MTLFWIDPSAVVRYLQQSGTTAPSPIGTDRPTFSDSSSLSGQGYWQFESGLTYDHVSRASITTVGELIIRHQVAPSFEIRAVNITGAFGSPDGPGGFEDPAVGFKYRLLAPTARLPEVTLICLTSVPFGSAAYRTNAFQPTVKLAWSRAVSPAWTLAGNLIYSRQGSASNAFDQEAASLYVSEALNAKTTLVYEVYGLSALASGGAGAAYADTGILQLVTNDCQLDLRIGSGLNERADGWYVGAGVAWRL